MSDFWEPWQPQIGDRVRVRLSGECQQQNSVGNDGHLTEFFTGHDDFEQGQAGTVVECPHLKRDLVCVFHRQGHAYAVKWDVGMTNVRSGRAHGGHYAAIELEPVETIR